MFVRYKKKQKTHKFAIIVPNGNDVLKEIQTGLLWELGKHNNQIDFQYELIQGNNDIENLKNLVDSRLNLNVYDLIFSFGKTCTQIVKGITLKNRIYTPVVFGGVHNPSEAGISLSETYSGNHLTGVSAAVRNYTTEIRKLLAINNKIKRALIIRTSHAISHTEQDVINARQAFEKNNIMVLEIALSNPADIEKYLSSELLSKVDVMVSLRDHVLSGYIETLAQICNQYQILFYASDLVSIEKGASVAFGLPEHKLGNETAKKALPILLNQRHPKLVPIAPMPWEEKLIINSSFFQKQQLHIVFNLLAQKENTKII